MSNEADMAQDIELRAWKSLNERPTKQTRFEPHEPGYGPAECEECGTKLPEQRRAWGFDICVPCKQREELSNQRYV